eukprot:5654628-Amphidinium_carterae.1
MFRSREVCPLPREAFRQGRPLLVTVGDAPAPLCSSKKLLLARNASKFALMPAASRGALMVAVAPLIVAVLVAELVVVVAAVAEVLELAQGDGVLYDLPFLPYDLHTVAKAYDLQKPCPF